MFQVLFRFENLRLEMQIVFKVCKLYPTKEEKSTKQTKLEKGVGTKSLIML